MSCCGERRQAARLGQVPAGRRPWASVLEAPTPIRYVGDTPVVVRGANTGYHYTFSRRDEILTVDGRDVAPLLRLGLFAR